MDDSLSGGFQTRKAALQGGTSCSLHYRQAITPQTPNTSYKTANQIKICRKRNCKCRALPVQAKRLWVGESAAEIEKEGESSKGSPKEVNVNTTKRDQASGKVS